MDYKDILGRIEWNENRIREIRTDFIKLKEQVKSQEILDNETEPDIMKMFDEKFRIQYALRISNNKRRQAAKILNMSERSLYRLLGEYHLI